MPMYDYRRDDGTTFEAHRPYGQHEQAFDENGVEGVLVWITAPSAVIPVWHQSAPREDPHTVHMMRRAADPKDPVRVLEPGVNKDVSRAQKARERKRQERIDRNVTAAIREVNPNVPE